MARLYVQMALPRSWMLSRSFRPCTRAPSPAVRLVLVCVYKARGDCWFMGGHPSVKGSGGDTGQVNDCW
jgi:hypothetical protein